MSALLEGMASHLAAAAEASQRLRVYVGEIDRFLSTRRTPEWPETDAGRGHDGANTTYQQTWEEETMVPVELLERMFWDWA